MKLSAMVASTSPYNVFFVCIFSVYNSSMKQDQLKSGFCNTIYQELLKTPI